ncbi:MAG: hypothetical protein JXQ81_09180 [Desulfuromonadales bacterium]|nr:hypothetical protein [Desulfuromonadales bacterium]MBN2792664.1 hypothetical protein [Desulfuromonadales bacterium]
MQKLAQVIVFFSAALLCGCASIEFPSSFDTTQDIHAAPDAGTSRVIFFNPVSFGGVKLNLNMSVHIEIDGQAGPFIQHSQYFQVFLSEGEHMIKLEHVDPIAFSDTYKIVVSDNDLYVKVSRTLFGNSLEIQDQLPPQFEQEYKATKSYNK